MTNDNKGNWEFNFYQKKYDPINEAKLKQLMKLKNTFNPKNIDSYLNNNISKEEIILKKKNDGLKLKSNENIILNNYLSKNNTILNNDLENIKKFGMNSNPETIEGKISLLFYLLEEQLKYDKINKNNIVNIYFKLYELNFLKYIEIIKKYDEIIMKMDNIIKDIDLINLQFTIFNKQIPPLNSKGFTKLDDWQIRVINNINNNISTIINAPTSAGKSIISGYTIQKGNILYVVPTDALAWQISSYIEDILNCNVPILTSSYQSNPNREDMINLLNKSSAIVGTPNILVDYLPFIKNNFKWIIFDEIHMIGNTESHAMEYIIKLLPNVNFLALSATISNFSELSNWFRKIYNNIKIDEIICDKKFFNLQKYVYSTEQDKLIYLNPLSLITEENFNDGSVITKKFNPTPTDCWNLYQQINAIFNLDLLNHKNYFKDVFRIELDNINIYFNKLINFLYEKYQTDKENVIKIINTYKYENITNININKLDLIKLAFNLKSNYKIPAIFFHQNTQISLTIIREFAKK